MKSIEQLIIEHGEESEIVQEAIYEKELYEARVKGKTWEELMEGAREWNEVRKELGIKTLT
jgi:hypothetical protein